MWVIVRHVPCQADPSRSAATEKVWVYRTEVENDHDRPVRVIWFEFYYQHEDDWFGVNIRKRSLRTADFVEWYGDADGLDGDGWLAPGAVAACDPNYCFAFTDEITPVKWCFIAVDAEGNDYFAEAMVTMDAAALYDPQAPDGG